LGQVEAGHLDELPFGAGPFEEHHQLELEEVDGIDARSTPLGVALASPFSGEAEVKRGLQVAVEVVRRSEILRREGDRLVESAGLGRAERDGSWSRAA
jgi:hypothetical protein